MTKNMKEMQVKPTTKVLAVITVCIIIYIAVTKGNFFIGGKQHVVLAENKEIISLSIQDNDYIGLNGKQIIKVNRDGIIAYDLEGDEIWSDTLSIGDYIVQHREPYIAIGSKVGNKIELFSNKGKKAEIICDNPIVYFSVNKNGGIAVVQSVGNDAYMIAAYDHTGKFLRGRLTYVEADGYPAAVELSPNNELLLASYISKSVPVLTSTLIAIDTTKAASEVIDGVAYGQAQKDNFIYEIEFVKDDKWVSIGDKTITWYDLEGNKLAENSSVAPVFNPYINKITPYGKGYFPILSTQSPNKNIIHRVDELIYFNSIGEETFSIELEESADYFYTGESGVVIGTGNDFKGYNKLGNQTFEYHTSVDVSKLFYIAESKRGIAVTREKVILLSPKKEGK